MTRRVPLTLFTASLALSLGLSALWLRGLTTMDDVAFSLTRPASDSQERSGWQLNSFEGRLYLFHIRYVPYIVGQPPDRLQSDQGGIRWSHPLIPWQRSWSQALSDLRPISRDKGHTSVGNTERHWNGVSIADWLLLIPAASPAALALIRIRCRPKPGRCPTCNYDLRATPARCPECGTAVFLSPSGVTRMFKALAPE